ncbi:MAG: HEAT repeat domain-containing protein [Gemmataceae bacterium]|nr:HEAT repeat domain-containing protein [Gemmataceae bacterium]
MRRLTALCLGILVLALTVDQPAWAQKKKIEDLLKDLDSKTPQTRIDALNEIGKLAEIKLSYAQKALPQMREILGKDGDVKVRIAALGALGKVESETKEYVPNMLKYLKEDKDYGVQNTALGMLAAYQQEAAPAISPLKERLAELREANKDQDPGNIRSGILNTLAQINQNLNVPLSVEAIKDDKAISVKVNAVNRLSQIGQQGGAKETAPDLIAAYEESLKAGPNADLRRAILGALASIEPDPKKYLPLLTETLKKDKDAGLIVAVIVALGRGGSAAKEALPLVLEAQKNVLNTLPKDGADPNGQRRAMVESIVKLEPEPKQLVSVLLEVLKRDPEQGVRAAALAGLGGMGAMGKDAIAPLVAMQKAGTTAGAKDGNDPGDLRRLTMEALAKLGPDPKEMVPLLIDSVRRDKSYGVRMAAVRILGEIGAPAKSATSVLTPLLKLAKTANDQDKALAKVAGEALEKIGK